MHAKNASALVEADRDEAQVALALDQQQDRFAAGFLSVGDLAGDLVRRSSPLPARLP